MARAAQTTNGQVHLRPGFGPSPIRLTKASIARGGLYTEIGRTGLKHWGGIVLEETERDLQGGKRSAEAFKAFLDQSAVAGAVIAAVEMLCRRVDWWADPGGETSKDDEAKVFLEQCLFEDMSHSWADTLTEILSFLPFGWSLVETIWKQRGGDVRDPRRRSKFDDGKIGLRKLAIRSQDSLDEWIFDDEGGVQGMKQSPPPDYEQRTIPIDKALLFRTRPAKGNPEGRSVLRSAWHSWYMCKSIAQLEGIGIERDLAGLPVLKYTGNRDLWDTNDAGALAIRTEAEKLVSSIRRDEQEGVLLPGESWELSLLSTGGERSFSTTEIITRYESRIAMTVLADVILLGHEQVGSYALSQTKGAIFTAALEGYLDHVAEVLNRHLVPRIFRLNPMPGITDYPQVRHGKVEIVDLAELGAYIKLLSDSGMPLWPNQALEEKALEAASLPAPSEEELLAREIIEPEPPELEEPVEEEPAPPDQQDEEDDQLDVPAKSK